MPTSRSTGWLCRPTAGSQPAVCSRPWATGARRRPGIESGGSRPTARSTPLSIQRERSGQGPGGAARWQNRGRRALHRTRRRYRYDHAQPDRPPQRRWLLETKFNPAPTASSTPLSCNRMEKSFSPDSSPGSAGSTGATTRNRIGRLNTDGSLDTGFITGANGAASTLAVQPDGKILVGGVFTTLVVGTGVRHATKSAGSIPTARSTSVSSRGSRERTPTCMPWRGAAGQEDYRRRILRPGWHRRRGRHRRAQQPRPIHARRIPRHGLQSGAGTGRSSTSWCSRTGRF